MQLARKKPKKGRRGFGEDQEVACCLLALLRCILLPAEPRHDDSETKCEESKDDGCDDIVLGVSRRPVGALELVASRRRRRARRQQQHKWAG